MTTEETVCGDQMQAQSTLWPEITTQNHSQKMCLVWYSATSFIIHYFEKVKQNP